MVKIISDTSNSGWRGICSLPVGQHQTKDYWEKEIINLPGIATRKAKALHKTLSAFSEEVYNGRVIAHIDNTNLLDFRNNGGGRGRSLPLTDEIKDLFFLTSKLNILLKLIYMLSESNNADARSRFSSNLDCCLFDSSWKLLNKAFGPCTFDLMANPSNVKKDLNGVKKPFFSPHPFSESSGVDVYAQQFSIEQNYFVFSPFIFIGSLLKFLKHRCSRVTMDAQTFLQGSTGGQFVTPCVLKDC